MARKSKKVQVEELLTEEPITEEPIEETVEEQLPDSIEEVDEAGEGLLKEPKDPKLVKFGNQIDKICRETSLTTSDYPLQYSSTKNCISSGSYVLDLLLCGGFRNARLHVFFGPERSSKSTLIFHVIKAAQRQGIRIFHFDPEGAADENYMNTIGVNTQTYTLPNGDKGYWYFDTRNGIEVYQGIGRLLDIFPQQIDRNLPPSTLILVDSYKSLLPPGVEKGTASIADAARLHSYWQPILRSKIAKSGATLVATNQIRIRGIGGFIAYEDEAADNSIKHYADARFSMFRGKPGAIHKSWSQCPDAFCHVEMKVKKNRMCCSEGMVGHQRFKMGVGFDPRFDRLAFLVMIGEIPYKHKKFTIHKKSVDLRAALKIMQEAEWKDFCKQLASCEATYKQFYKVSGNEE